MALKDILKTTEEARAEIHAEEQALAFINSKLPLLRAGQKVSVTMNSSSPVLIAAVIGLFLTKHDDAAMVVLIVFCVFAASIQLLGRYHKKTVKEVDDYLIKLGLKPINLEPNKDED
jgi:hypothetical protein